MTVNEALRLIAGLIVALSIILAVIHSIAWLWIGVFVSANLIQSAFTGWCPMMILLHKLGLPESH